MKKSLFIPFMLTFAILAGCGNNAPEASEPVAANAVTAQPEETKAPEPTATPKPELSATDQLALDYVNLFLNTTDLDEKQKFVEDHVHEETKTYFELDAMAVHEDRMFKNPVLAGTTDYETGGQKGEIALLKNDSGKELILWILDGKLHWVFHSDNTEAEFKKAFEEMRAEFK